VPREQAAILILALVLTSQVSADSVPFVAGFDRFAQSHSTQAGQLLLTELGCTACHLSDHDALQAKRGPVLESVGRRLSPDWVRQFLADPQQAKPGTTMPHMMADWDDAEKQRAIDALVAFLGTQQKPLPEIKSTAARPLAVRFWSKGDASRGKQLYHQVGCVACHAPDAEYQLSDKEADDKESDDKESDDEELEEWELERVARPVRSIPHPDLQAKYSARSLTHFLFDPLATRPSGRMPNLKLDPEAAADIAAYLLIGKDEQGLSEFPSPAGELVATGKKLFEELRCVNCHAVAGTASADPVSKLQDLNTDLSASCIGKSQRKSPHYPLEDSQRSSLRQAIARTGVDETVDLRLMQLNCYACHQRDGRGGVGPRRRQFFQTVGHVDLGDEGRIPPPLDGVGRKLTNGWFKKVFFGTGDVRPHLTIRMPIFGVAADSLVDGFATIDSTDQTSDSLEKTESSVEAGSKLLDLGCVQCHPLRGEYLAGVVGVDLAGIDRRVRSEWFRQFMLDPASLKKRTRMPSFFRDGKSSSEELLGGNVDQQIASLWAYLKDVDKYALPEKIEQARGQNFELIPHEKPILLRTFMDRAGPHAIAVGFPKGVHLAFDAESVGIVQLWRGRFMDAHGTWFDRFTPPAKPLGSDLIELPSGGAFAISPAGELPIYLFRGYRLDRHGVPTFLYRFGSVDVEDRFAPSDDDGFRRRIRLSLIEKQKPPKRVWFRAIVGRQLKSQSEVAYKNEQGLIVAIDSGLQDEPRLRSSEGESTWLIPIEIGQENEIEVRYNW